MIEMIDSGSSRGAVPGDLLRAISPADLLRAAARVRSSQLFFSRRASLTFTWGDDRSAARLCTVRPQSPSKVVIALETGHAAPARNPRNFANSRKSPSVAASCASDPAMRATPLGSHGHRVYVIDDEPVHRATPRCGTQSSNRWPRRRASDRPHSHCAADPHSHCVADSASHGALDGIRTHTGAGLSRLPLPLGYEGWWSIITHGVVPGRAGRWMPAPTVGRGGPWRGVRY